MAKKTQLSFDDIVDRVPYDGNNTATTGISNQKKDSTEKQDVLFSDQ